MSDDSVSGCQVQFSLWCLNPGCIFRELGEQARSVLVTSGTLAPMTSFASELGIPFKYRLETPHVIAKEQVRRFCQSCHCSYR
jgi:fanconi anemia group J protein